MVVDATRAYPATESGRPHLQFSLHTSPGHFRRIGAFHSPRTVAVLPRCVPALFTPAYDHQLRNRTWLSHGHPNPGRRVDVITSCLRSKIETNFVPTVSFAMGIADTDVQLCPLSCAPAHPRARPFIGHWLDTDRQVYAKY